MLDYLIFLVIVQYFIIFPLSSADALQVAEEAGSSHGFQNTVGKRLRVHTGSDLKFLACLLYCVLPLAFIVNAEFSVTALL